ncbi:tRNA epoxyqueuosine(34) reductase QueG [Nibricoccus aquaticus]|uniref:tRNA epoxyqueuosine(34) reductase QueG n=1 Tax=Nibricoccus aquaticus TaxID=2576891 RepID=A0A290Q8E5_9BACT|nr:tRNA epoxyqueuosine(34) reductase QueG [Nibricoccus aquaticus]ATC64919.1 tRNA epoxyqueuosine(34) reductase QueG [Nibricoccus aquaticus]
MSEAREELRRRLRALGFDEVRFARMDAPFGAGLRARMEAGQFADMDWMGRTADKRTNPDLVLPGVKTMIMLGVNYWPGAEAMSSGGGDEVGKPVWARYALHADYHDTIKPALVAAGKVLEELCGATAEDYRYYVDTGPVQERGWAERAGLGFIGKNAMLISREFGNWLFLATILTRVEIAPDEPLSAKHQPHESGEPRVGLLCGKCSRCMDECPTEAIVAPGVVDARRCVSYQTIENKGTIPRELRAGIGRRIYGCDVCAEVCPWNRFAQESRKVLLAARYELADLSLREVLELTPVRFAEVFRKTAIKRVKLAGLLRNACVVAGNTRAEECVEILVRLAGHESALVRGHAVWAVYRIAGHARAGELLAVAKAGERDEGVLAEYGAEGG